jgi:hypothetical protein
VALSTVHVNRTLQRLRSEGLISWKGRAIMILDWARLQQAASFDDLYLHQQQAA